DNISIDVSKFASEQCYRLFVTLFNADLSIPGSLSLEQYCCLYAVLIAIDSSLTGSLPDARSVICDITNEQKNNRPLPQKPITPLITTATDVLDSTDTTIETINISQGRGKKKQVKPKIKKTLRQTRSNKKAKT
ncbi:6248_t:CDS:2, partial [Funneliformis mosseae]